MKFIILMLTLLGLLILLSCNPLRHYQKVATDPFRNSSERSLLSTACTNEFPAIRDTPKVVYSGVDSSDYLAVAEAYNVLVDSLIAHNERDTGSAIIIRYRITDSLKMIKEFLKTYHPPAVIQTIIKEVPVRNTAIENQLQSSIDNCRSENENLAKSEKAATDKVKAARANTGWWIGGGLFLAIVTYIIGSARRKTIV